MYCDSRDRDDLARSRATSRLQPDEILNEFINEFPWSFFVAVFQGGTARVVDEGRPALRVMRSRRARSRPGTARPPAAATGREVTVTAARGAMKTSACRWARSCATPRPMPCWLTLPKRASISARPKGDRAAVETHGSPVQQTGRPGLPSEANRVKKRRMFSS